MTTPTYCSDCGHELGAGRFCTNCGRPVPGRHPEAAPVVTEPAHRPAEPPPVGPLPPAPRFPLYAEDQSSPTIQAGGDPPPTLAQPSPSVPPPGPPPPYVAPRPSEQPRGRRGLVPWLVLVLFLGLIAGLGAFLVLRPGDDDHAATDAEASDSGPADPGSESPGHDPGQPDQPDQPGTDDPVPAPDPDDVIDLTANVSAKVPGTAPPSRDRGNKPVRFDAANMWDGKPRTAWRTPGDGSGSSVTFELGQEAVITRVGLINGYAKKDGPVNWYAGNRRIRAVQWEFDDGTRVTQDLLDREAMQLIEVGPVRTRTITLHLLDVSRPGGGPNGRDYTAISEVRFLGAPS